MPETSRTRPLTPEERSILMGGPSLHSPFHLLWDIGIASFGVVGCGGTIAVLGIAAVLGMMEAGRTVSYIAIALVIGLVVVIASSWTLIRYSVARRRELNEKARVDADLASGIASVERHRATGALRAIMEEHRERAYFMRLEDGRAMFVGFWNPPEHDNPAGIQGMPVDLKHYPTEGFEIARGPASGRILAVTFVGPTLPVLTTFEYRQGVNTPQLNVGDIAPVPWEQIQKTYG